MLKIGETYKVTHRNKGVFKCRIVYETKKHVCVTLTDSLDIFDVEFQWGKVKVGDDVRMLKRQAKFEVIK